MPINLKEAMLKALIWCLVFLTTAIFVWLLSDLVQQGWQHLSFDFLRQEPLQAGRSGGIGPVLVSTAWVVLICLSVALPISLGAAIWLNRFTPANSRLSRSIRLLLDILAGVPSIVFGLFGAAFFGITLGLGFSILSGGLTLACMILPLMIRTTEAGLAAVPTEWTHGAAALGIGHVSTLWHLQLPAALPTILAGLLLSLGRALSETAALLFTSGYVTRFPESWLDSGRVLSVHIYDLAMNVTGGNAAAYASALTLIILLILINGIAMRLASNLQQRSLHL
ncbi:MAG: phosphate ABC transporter, permease protein PstA [Acinetobacter sp.]|nr:phosphate ABC transporter, permease protein PstA [Acinetobacter sp.]